MAIRAEQLGILLWTKEGYYPNIAAIARRSAKPRTLLLGFDDLDAQRPEMTARLILLQESRQKKPSELQGRRSGRMPMEFVAPVQYARYC
jgi:hypothetical protein